MMRITEGLRILLTSVLLAALPLSAGGVDARGGSKTVSEQSADAPRSNHLIHEKSPYLLQHAYNPVDWYPWGKEAFERAERENKPIFLSIGYSTCHWCHVMERESYSNRAIAKILNEHFIAIKVDREERPDVDAYYLSFLQATTGDAGWPANIFLTPARTPFFGGTYFPPNDGDGRVGLATVLERVAAQWETDHEKVVQTGSRLTALIESLRPTRSKEELDPRALSRAERKLAALYDSTNGGFGTAPKFPQPSILGFLLRQGERSGTLASRTMVLHSLRSLARGGIHDHLGGGFHRYATDEKWRRPHFEKMLYDQALLSIAYIEGWQIDGDREFQQTARSTLEYVLRDLRDSGGGFYSAEDADSPHRMGEQPREGGYYTWTRKELQETLGNRRGEIFAWAYGVGGDRGAGTRGDVLFEAHAAAETATKFGMHEDETVAALDVDRRLLLAARRERPRPQLDDKILAAWNGLMISALARGAAAFDEPKYLDAATAAARFLETRMFDRQREVLYRRYRGGEAGIDGFPEDYACVIQGMIDLYEAGFDVHWLELAVGLQEIEDQLFWDERRSGYLAARGPDAVGWGSALERTEGAEPSAEAISALNLLRLSQITARDDWKKRAEAVLRSKAPVIADSPEGVPQMLAAYDYDLSEPKQIVIAGAAGRTDTKRLLGLVNGKFLPHRILLLADGGPGQRRLAGWLPFIGEMRMIGGKATAYICEHYVCKLPSSDPAVVARQLISN